MPRHVPQDDNAPAARGCRGDSNVETAERESKRKETEKPKVLTTTMPDRRTQVRNAEGIMARIAVEVNAGGTNAGSQNSSKLSVRPCFSGASALHSAPRISAIVMTSSMLWWNTGISR